MITNVDKRNNNIQYGGSKKKIIITTTKITMMMMMIRWWWWKRRDANNNDNVTSPSIHLYFRQVLVWRGCLVPQSQITWDSRLRKTCLQPLLSFPRLRLWFSPHVWRDESVDWWMWGTTTNEETELHAHCGGICSKQRR